MIVRAATAFGIRIPPPMPVRARTAMKEAYVVQNALQREKTMKIAPPRSRSLR